ncbi:MAG TPA: LuxR C-terminal-related transcriptional regulator, partial [Roseiflexaceae bacterium]|nr:LuxR C-terminal-related transcriptional regulator [Roseiflexaceae bacterium]
PLCNAVTGRTDSAACLQRLTQANIFIIPLDEHREWYRYHPLFAEFLRSVLRSDEYPMLHRRAAHWYRAQGFLEEAVDHALASNDRELAADLIAQAAGWAILPGHLTTLPGWLSVAPEARGRLIQSVRPAAVLAETLALLEPLSRREGEILRLIETGMPNEAVAHALVIAPGTVKKHLDNIYGKLGVHNRTAAVARARQLELL